MFGDAGNKCPDIPLVRFDWQLCFSWWWECRLRHWTLGPVECGILPWPPTTGSKDLVSCGLGAGVECMASKHYRWDHQQSTKNIYTNAMGTCINVILHWSTDQLIHKLSSVARKLNPQLSFICKEFFVACFVIFYALNFNRTIIINIVLSFQCMGNWHSRYLIR